MDSKKLDFVHLRFEIIVWLNKIIDFVWSWSPIKTRYPDLKKLSRKEISVIDTFQVMSFFAIYDRIIVYTNSVNLFGQW